jgi:hypothetical protein
VRRLDWAPESNPTSGEQALVKRYTFGPGVFATLGLPPALSA